MVATTQRNDKDVAGAYPTDHLYLAAYLRCSGHEIVGTTCAGDRVSFIFHLTPALSADVAKFMSGAVVPARKFSFEVLKLKRLIPRSKRRLEKDEKYLDTNNSD
jgi:hypothetical protein